MKTLSRPEKIAYLNRWLTRARVMMYAPGALLIGLSMLGASFVRYLPNIQMLEYFILFALATTTVLNVLVLLLTKSRLRSCVTIITAEFWTDRADVPLLLEILQQALPIPYTFVWAREQLANAVI